MENVISDLHVIEEDIEKFVDNLKAKKTGSQALLECLENIKWIKETNSHPEGLAKPEEIRETLNSIINQIEETGGTYEKV
jgi:hypothetical protein